MLKPNPARHRARLVTLAVRPTIGTSSLSRGNRAALHSGSSSGAAAGEQVWLRSPRDLAQHLDEHIIGQERAKKILSVAVFNHYHRVTTLLDRSQDLEELHNMNVGDPEPDLEDSGTQFTGSTVATATITPKPRKRRSDTTGTNDSSSTRKEGAEDGFIDPDQYEREHRTDPTLIHSPEEWSTAQPGFYDKAFPPPSPRHAAESSRVTDTTQPSTLLGRLARGSIAAGRSTQSDGLAALGPDQSVEPFADIRATNSPASLSRKTEKSGRQPSKIKDSGKGVRGKAKEETARMAGEANEEAEELGWRDEDLASMEDVVIEKSNVLMIGPTGSGKTLLAKTLARILDVPFASSDATSFTQAGYVGDDVENCVLRLLRAADHDVARTEIGIIHIDECDKLARRGGGGDGAWGGRDVGGEGVQQALLKLLEGTTVTLQAKPGSTHTPTPIGPGRLTDPNRDQPTQRGFGGTWGSGQHDLGYGAKKGVREGLPLHGGGGGGANPKGETFTVDTSNILFILSGSFVGLEKIIGRRTGKGSIGFGATLPQLKRESETEDEVAETVENGGLIQPKKDRLKGLSTADLVEYGFIPEFVGRLPSLAPLHPLSLSDLVRILIEPKNALIKQYRKLFARYGCELQFSEKALYAVAEEASKRGGSARHLRSTLEELLLDAMYEIPGSAIKYAAVTEDVVKRTIPTLYYSRGQRETFYMALEADTDTRQSTLQQDDEGEELMRATA
ncbi:hypothetical protein QFC20_004648 [Naganishia adeliensis]|uniref:Uncharacterized protein n=1 Tax=Naganishia adeliensis TaxID=92952 RepID=A0ACC2VZ46_9TREE|nr:hypothetical protein QFC20_004648 [Naganishia adeliensis]